MRPVFLSLGLALALMFALAPSASAAPVMCTDSGTNLQGITATHLFAKVDGVWVEPQNVCVRMTIEEKARPIGGIGRILYMGVWNTLDGGPETQLPPGTLISLGLRRPPGTVVQWTWGGWRDSVVVSGETDTVIQGRTVPWNYHPEAFGGGALDCSMPPTAWQSTFTGLMGLNALNQDRTPNFDLGPYAGAFYEANTVYTSLPTLTLGADGEATGVQLTVNGCGDDDPSTLEGYFDGFTPISVFRAFGITPDLLRDSALLQDLLEVRDLTARKPIRATFRPVTDAGLSLEPVPGVDMPSQPWGQGLIGVRVKSRFSYSTRTLVERGKPSAMEALRNCRAEGGTPAANDGHLSCMGVMALRAKLAAPRSLKRGRAVTVSCNKPCSVTATATARRQRVAHGRATRTKAGKVRVPLKLTAAGRRRLVSRPTLRTVLRVSVSDLVGNTVRLARPLQITR